MAFQELEDTTRKLLKRVGAVEATANGPTSWGDLTSVPAAFPPSAHTLASHTGEIANAQLPTRLREITTSITDANTIFSTGWYRGSGVANAPGTNWHYYEVVAHDSATYVYQRATEYFDPHRVFQRWCTAGVWSAWEQIASHGKDGTPFAMAAGRVAMPTGGTFLSPLYYSSTVTVTLPSGRFSVAPIVTASAAGPGVLYSSIQGLPTTTSFVVIVTRLNAAISAGTEIDWTATQMTSGAAAG